MALIYFTMVFAIILTLAICLVVMQMRRFKKKRLRTYASLKKRYATQKDLLKTIDIRVTQSEGATFNSLNNLFQTTKTVVSIQNDVINDLIKR